MKKKKREEHTNSERWLLSYSDFMTLLMILFVVLYAMSSIDQAKFAQLSQSLNMAMGGGKSIIAKENGTDANKKTTPIDTNVQQSEQAKMQDLKKQVDKYLKDNNMSSSVSTQLDQRGLIVSLNNTLFFDTGNADIKPDFQNELIGIAKILNQIKNNIRIEGHTDTVPISNSQFSSNWQLSCARAANVTQFLIDKAGIPANKLSAVGYSEYRPVSDNSTEEGRAKNRRVDIIIENSEFNKIDNNVKGNSSNTNTNSNDNTNSSDNTK
ncbi:chemotaxis protein MotB [Clostridium fermenticellae]|uniref:Chemotaxis protein MotB n=1 Tax=Clostridium fermenticellae TaxID=2068654 RepID=A0A386H0B9_9CLOT|nr:flagellar motor protein MotB [Clostridium fermenticellae]AYD39111.1 chemotaxis protein MotB [Clostridium fermenticellae]